MRRLIIVTALVVPTVLVAPATTNASYISGYGGKCILTGDGTVYFRAALSASEGLGDFEWVLLWRKLDRDGPWQEAVLGYQYIVDRAPEAAPGWWETRFKSDPRVTTDRAYKVVLHGGYGPYTLASYSDDRQNPDCVTRAT
jgi:hypothetical protein